MTTERYQIELGEPPPGFESLVGVRLRFAPTRTVVVAVDVASHTDAWVEGAVPVVDVRWEGSSLVPPGAIDLVAGGEAPSLIDVEEMEGVPDWAISVEWLLRPPPDLDESTALEAGEDRPTNVWEARDHFIRDFKAWRAESIKRATPDIKPYLDFFAALEDATSPAYRTGAGGLSDSPVPVPVLRRASATLQTRVEQRLASIRAGGPATPANLASIPRDDLVEIAEVQKNLLGQHVVRSSGSVSEMFELFAWGKLKRPVGEWNAEPNSAFYLLFTEFAIACIQATPSVDPAVWKPFLTQQTWTEEIYYTVYRPPLGERTWSGYRGIRDGSRLSKSLSTAIRDHYKALTTSELIEEHVWNAYHTFSDAAAVHAHEYPAAPPNLRRPWTNELDPASEPR